MITDNLLRGLIMYKKIESIEQLKDLACPMDGFECFIALADGSIKSTKHIWYEDNEFTVINESDDTEEIFTEQELFDESLTNIGRAINAGALYYEQL